MRFVLRAIGLVVLAFGVVFAAGDIARSLAEEAPRLISVGGALASLGVVSDGAAPSGFLAPVLSWPMAVTAGLFGFLLIALGRRPRHRASRRFVDVPRT